MEEIEQIRDTLREFNIVSPNALCCVFGIPPRGGAPDSDVAGFLADAFQPQKREGGDPMNVDGSAGAFRLDWASCYIPNHDEDAHFGYADASVVGVADGVGARRKEGVDAGAFSRALMTGALELALAHEPGAPVCPYTLLERAYADTAAAGVQASSTACILSIVHKSLRWAYIGDSGFAILRSGNVVHRSKVQQRGFNNPFQLSAKGGDSVTLAKVGEMPVREGDVVVLGTDGLFDNMFNDELERAVQLGMALGFSPNHMANIVAGLAYEMSRSTAKDSPFAVKSREQRKAGNKHVGGKRDDITVIVAFVVRSDS